MAEEFHHHILTFDVGADCGIGKAHECYFIAHGLNAGVVGIGIAYLSDDRRFIMFVDQFFLK